MKHSVFELRAPSYELRALRPSPISNLQSPLSTLPSSSVRFSVFLTVATLVTTLLAPHRLIAQEREQIPQAWLEQVMPGADRFGERSGDPPVIRAYQVDAQGGNEVLIGYVFLTRDVPPEERGYSGPIEAVVGMDLEGWLTGVRVWDYWESHLNTRGDFLRVPGFQEQYAGKHIADPFAVRQDVDGISRATVTVRALSRGVRNSARRVAEAYMAGPEPSMEAIDDLTSLSWLEMIRLGVVERMVVTDGRPGSGEIFLAHIEADAFGELLVGPDALGMITRRLDASDEDDHAMVYAVNGSYVRFFRGEGWSVAQDGDTIPLARQELFAFGGASGGMMRQQAGVGGAMIIDETVDMTRPFSILFRFEPEAPLFAAEYVTQAGRRAGGQAGEADEADEADETGGQERRTGADGLPSPLGGVGESGGPPAVELVTDDAADTAEETDGPPSPPGGVGESGGPPGVGSGDAVGPPPLDFTVVDEETALTMTLSGASWARVVPILLLLGLATGAFFLKNTKLTWVTLGVTLLFLGFVDGGFLSVSHITSGIWVGWSAFLSDLPLLLMVAFTIVTTLWLGRVLCGFLCPFGALQDFLTRLVPRRFRRRVPWGVHRRALYIKYGVLAFVLIPALAGSRESLYQYVEPFGTVFFRSSSLLLWAIAVAFLAASAVIPRFYCRYVCPLGAALGVVSLISLKRIGRVEQCGPCKVCEHKCPTGAIRGPVINFKECVRCNICEIELNERAGVCGHDMEDVRQRLVQLRGVGSSEQ